MLVIEVIVILQANIKGALDLVARERKRRESHFFRAYSKYYSHSFTMKTQTFQNLSITSIEHIS